MPWQECSKMDERLRFVARLLEGEKIAVLCREFEISHNTEYKIFARYRGSMVNLPNDLVHPPAAIAARFRRIARLLFGRPN